MSERDPKIDPKKGDIVQGASGEKRGVAGVREGQVFRIVTYKSNRAPDYQLQETSLQEWQRWASTATVVLQSHG